MLNDITYDLPAGPGNLESLFPTIDFRTVAEYQIELEDDQQDLVITTPVFKMSKEWTAPSMVRLHFLNYLGRYDSIAFHWYNKNNDVKSDNWIKPLAFPLKKNDGGMTRTNVRARDGYSCKHYTYGESAQSWLEELLESPIVYMEILSTDGQPDDFIPVVITDKSTITRKEEERYVYETQVDFKMSNEKIGIRI